MGIDLLRPARSLLLFGLLLSGELAAAAACAGEVGLAGDWARVRPALAKRGIEIEAVLLTEAFGIVSGGDQRGVALRGQFDLMVFADLEKAIGWTRANLFGEALADFGESPSALAGDAQTISNIDGPDAVHLYQAWLEQRFASDRLSVLAGLYDLNGDFDAIGTAMLFLGSSFGVGKDFSQSGENGPSIFPATSLAVRVAGRATEQLTLRAAVLDGVPNDPTVAGGTRVRWSSDEGILLVAEADLAVGDGDDGRWARAAIGAWTYTADFASVDTPPAGEDPDEIHGGRGAYLLGEGTLFRERDDPAQGLAAFARCGFADDRVHVFGWYAGGGLVYTGLIPGRDEDQFGLGVAAAIAGSSYRRAEREAGNRVRGEEVAIEATYRIAIFPWLAIQPDLQYVVNPGLAADREDAIAVGVRSELSF